MYKLALITFPIFVSIFLLFSQPASAQEAAKQPAQASSSAKSVAEEPLESDKEEADEPADDQANFQEVTPKDKKTASKPRPVIASGNGDAIRDIGEDEAGN